MINHVEDVSNVFVYEFKLSSNFLQEHFLVTAAKPLH